MESEFNFNSDYSSEYGVVKKFEEMLFSKKTIFFDVDEFEDILNYYSEENETEKALKAVRYALDLHPKSASLLLSCAQLYVSIHKPQEALRFLNQAEEIAPYDIDLYYTKATIFSQLRRYNKAIEQYKKALAYADDEEKEDILMQLAFEYENAGQYEQSIRTLQEILEERPENEMALYELGFCYDHIDQIDEGKKFFLSFIDEHPYSYIAWFNLGITYSKLKLYEKAIEAYDFSIAIKEDFTSAQINKASCYTQNSEYEKAIECYTETLEYDEDDPMIFTFIGECYEKMEQYDRAIYYYRKAILTDNYMPDAWFGLANVYYELGMDKEALSYIEEAIEKDSSNYEFYHLRGDILIQLGNSIAAILDYEKVLEHNSEDEEIYIDTALAYQDMNDIEEAIKVFQEGIDKQAENAKLLYNFAAFLLRNNKTVLAYYYLNIALESFYDQRAELFEAFEEAKNNEEVINLIEYHKR